MTARVAARTFWIVDRGFDKPRLVTAYPVSVHGLLHFRERLPGGITP